MKKKETFDLDHILKTAKCGNKIAEEELFGYLRERFFYLAKRRIRNEDAKDIAQEACIIVLRKYKFYERQARFEAWAYKILQNLIGNYLQHKKIEHNHELEAKNGSQQIQNPSGEIDPIFERKLLNSLRKIMIRNKLYARVLNLTHLGFKTEEICDQLNISANYYYVVLNRGRNALKLCLEESGNDGK